MFWNTWHNCWILLLLVLYLIDAVSQQIYIGSTFTTDLFPLNIIEYESCLSIYHQKRKTVKMGVYEQRLSSANYHTDITLWLIIKQKLIDNDSITVCRATICHYNYVTMGTMASEITSTNPTIAYSTIYSGADQRKHQSSASLAFVRGIHRWPVNSPHKWPVTRKMLPFDDVIMS